MLKKMHRRYKLSLREVMGNKALFLLHDFYVDCLHFDACDPSIAASLSVFSLCSRICNERVIAFFLLI